MQVSSQRRVNRAQCSNCTCSPGLLSRTNKRSSWFAKQINLKRNPQGSSLSRSGSRKGSVFTINAASLCLPDTQEVNTSQRLAKLRQVMAEYNLGIYIVPSEDQHQSEYVSAFDQKRSFISGFQGSAGVAIITRDVTSMNETPDGLAALSTDGRYFNQATNELDFNWTLLKQGGGNISWEDWTIKQAIQLSLDSGSKINIGVDPKLINYQLYEKINFKVNESSKRNPKAEIELVAIKDNLIEKIWGEFEEIPIKTFDKSISLLNNEFTGETVKSKLERIINYIKNDISSNGLIISSLDEIAWLLNLRGCDIEYNPVFYSYLIITDEGEINFFVDKTRFSDVKIEQYLLSNHISIKPYEEFWINLIEISKKFNLMNKKFSIIPNSNSWEIVRNLKCSWIPNLRSPIEDFKSIKNDVELQGARKAHLKDGRALIKFFSWLENELNNKIELIDECQANDQLTNFRKEEEHFVGLSFETISATGSNGAIIHYKPIRGNCSIIDPNNIYLNDSGSQFLEGTTDITRTFHFNKPTKDQCKNYTLVLKGNIALANLKFPENTTGNLIDSIARQHLWNYGLDYGHGTSHGIGSYLNVHEGPIGIGPRPNAATSFLKPGQIISNEPGYYEDDEYGIRIENVMIIKKSGYKYAGKNFLEFETITKVPFCHNLIDKSLLTKVEIDWINNYHSEIWNLYQHDFTKNSLEYNWLKRETSPL